MSYNWEKIFKSKSDKELFQIYQGEKHLNKDAQESARAELEERGFEFDDVQKHKDKWKLESLIKEEQEAKNIFSAFSKNPSYYLLTSISGGVTLIIAISLTISYLIGKPIADLQKFDLVFINLLGLTALLSGTFMFRKTKRKQKSRHEQIKNLIEKL